MARPLIAALVALATAAAAACGGDAPASEGDDAVQFLVFGDPEELAAYGELIAAYEEATPGASVEVIEASDRADLIARVSTSISGGEPPDVFLLNYRYYGQFAAKDALHPVDDRLAASDVIDEEDFYPQALDAFRWDGKLQCLAQNISSLAVYYNRDLFRRWGVPEPQPGWTWTDMLTTASATTRDAAGNPVRAAEAEGRSPVAVYGLGVDPTLIRIAPFVWSNGGELVDDEERPTRLTFDDPASREALRAFLELRLAYGVVPTDEEVEAEADEARFANGRLAMLLSSRRATTTFRSIRDFEWDVAPLPVFKEPAGILHADAYCIPAGAGDRDEAWDFVEFANSREGQTIIAGTGRTVPSRIDVSHSPAFLDPSKPPAHSEVFLDAIETVRRSPSTSTWPEIEDVTDGILENALYLGEPVDDVIRRLDEATRPLFARGENP
jgi:multiple sugar transport system substrate-binding protein